MLEGDQSDLLVRLCSVLALWIFKATLQESMTDLFFWHDSFLRDVKCESSMRSIVASSLD